MYDVFICILVQHLAKFRSFQLDGSVKIWPLEQHRVLDLPYKGIWRAFADGLIDKTKTQNVTLECKNHTLFETKMAKLDTSTLFLTKTAKKQYSLGYAHTYISYRKEKPRVLTKVI